MVGTQGVVGLGEDMMGGGWLAGQSVLVVVEMLEVGWSWWWWGRRRGGLALVVGTKVGCLGGWSW